MTLTIETLKFVLALVVFAIGASTFIDDFAINGHAGALATAVIAMSLGAALVVIQVKVLRRRDD